MPHSTTTQKAGDTGEIPAPGQYPAMMKYHPPGYTLINVSQSGAILPPGGHMAKSRDIFGCYNWEGNRRVPSGI